MKLNKKKRVINFLVAACRTGQRCFWMDGAEDMNYAHTKEQEDSSKCILCH